METFDSKKIRKIMYSDYESCYKSKLTNFGKYDDVYFWTNEQLSKYKVYDLSNKNVLTITSSGDHMLYAILNNAKEVDCFDVNFLCKFLATLKVAMIKAFSYDDFFKYMDTLFNKGVLSEHNNKKIFDFLEPYLKPLEINFWRSYVDFINENESNCMFLKNDYHCRKKNNPYYKKENYDILKTKINNCNISYYDMDIINIKEKLNNKKYDVIFLSNIITKIKDFGMLDKNKQLEFIYDLFTFLNNGGELYDYHFFNDSDDFSDELSKKFVLEKRKTGFRKYVNVYKKN